MRASPIRNVRVASLIACCLSLGWLAVTILPIALYQYFYISMPGLLGEVLASSWSVYLAPLRLMGWTPTLSSVDPLITLVPSFAMLFALWSLALSVPVFGWRQLRRAA
jgi:hypothetical protein